MSYYKMAFLLEKEQIYNFNYFDNETKLLKIKFYDIVEPLYGIFKLHFIIQKKLKQVKIMVEPITIQYVSSLTSPTTEFLCKPEDNIYGIEFVYFKIRNVDTNQTLFQIKKPENDIGKVINNPTRSVQYHFGPHFFKLSTIGTTLQFRVGNNPVKKFLMIERHYFKGKEIKSYEFQVPFCIPKTQNSLQAVYDLPQFTNEEIQQMIQSPFETVSDSFYFVEGKLVMHNKAAYSYAPFD